LEYSVPTKAPVIDHLMRTRSKTGFVLPEGTTHSVGPLATDVGSDGQPKTWKVHT
jgi:hypothetical protein